METLSPRRVVDRYLQAGYGPALPGWDSLVDNLRKRFPAQKWGVTESRSGSLIWDYQIMAGSRPLVWAIVRGEYPRIQYEFRVYGDREGGPMVNIEPPRGSPPPTSQEMQGAVDKVLAASPLLVASFQKKGLTPEQADTLKAAVTAAQQALKALIAVPLEGTHNGSFESGDYWHLWDYDIDEYNHRTPFRLVIHQKKGRYEISSYGEKLEFKTFKGFCTALTQVAPFIKKGMRSLDQAERDWIQGKLTPDAVVRKLEGVKVSYGRIDEWQDTHVEVTLSLRTSKAVPQKLLTKWVTDHWAEVLLKIPKDTKAPAPAPASSRGMPYDEPQAGLGWISPFRVRPDQGEIFVSQKGAVATVQVNASNR